MILENCRLTNFGRKWINPESAVFQSLTNSSAVIFMINIKIFSITCKVSIIVNQSLIFRKNFVLPCTLEIHNSAIIQEISWDVKNSHELLLNYRYQVHDYHQTGWKYALTGPSQLTCVELFCKAPEPIYLFQKKHLNYIKNTSTAS